MRLADPTSSYLYRGRGSGPGKLFELGGRCRDVKIPVGIALALVGCEIRRRRGACVRTLVPRVKAQAERAIPACAVLRAHERTV
jgi:hypothetical protein